MQNQKALTHVWVFVPVCVRRANNLPVQVQAHVDSMKGNVAKAECICTYGGAQPLNLSAQTILHKHKTQTSGYSLGKVSLFKFQCGNIQTLSRTESQSSVRRHKHAHAHTCTWGAVRCLQHLSSSQHWLLQLLEVHAARGPEVHITYTTVTDTAKRKVRTTKCVSVCLCLCVTVLVCVFLCVR